MEQIKRANKLFSNDCIFLRNSLNIPVVSEKRSIFNGLSLESPDGDGEAVCQEADTPCVVTQDIEGPSPPPSPPPADSKPPQPQPEELSAKDFLHRLDLQIKQSKQAARRLKEEEVRWGVELTPSQTAASALCVQVFGLHSFIPNWERLLPVMIFWQPIRWCLCWVWWQTGASFNWWVLCHCWFGIGHWVIINTLVLYSTFQTAACF